MKPLNNTNMNLTEGRSLITEIWLNVKNSINSDRVSVLVWKKSLQLIIIDFVKSKIWSFLFVLADCLFLT